MPKIEKGKVKVAAIQCLKCGDIIYSRAVHDFHWCSCKSVAIDGGFDYVKICGEPTDYVKIKAMSIPATKWDLYVDWNTNTNKFGWIKAQKLKPKKTKKAVKKRGKK